ncbi:hypothetical protein [Thiolapillus sp.]
MSKILATTTISSIAMDCKEKGYLPMVGHLACALHELGLAATEDAAQGGATGHE